MGRIDRLDELRFARPIPVGAPDWLGDDIPASIPESTRMRGGVFRFHPWKPQPLSFRTASGVLDCNPPDTITFNDGPPARASINVVDMCGWDYPSVEAGTMPLRRAPLGMRLARANLY